MAKGIKTLVIGMVGLFALFLWAGLSFAESRVVVKVGAVSPEEVTIAKGQEVTWDNATGGVIHIEFATQPGGHLFQVSKGQTVRVKFEQPGEHRYWVHIGAPKAPDLQGVVVVR